MRKKWINRFLAMFLLGLLLLVLGQSGQAQEVLWTSPYGGYDVATDSAENVLLTGGKLTPDGDTLWMRTLSGLTAHGVAADPWGNVIVTGYTHTDSTSKDYCTIKYSPDGDTLWTRTYGTENMDEAHGVATDPSGNVIVTGWFDAGPYSGIFNYCTIKYDTNGKILWKRIFDWKWEDFAHDVAVDGEGNVIVTGQSDNNINWDWCTVKYSPDGDTLWIRRVDVGIDDFPYGVATDPWDNVIVVGEVHIGGYQQKAYAIKYGPKGDTLWARLYHDIGGEFCDVATDTAGNVILKSWLKLIKCKPNGDTLWTISTPGYGGSVTTDLSGNIIITNGSETIKYKGNSGIEGDTDYSFPKAFSLSQNYPNPFNSATLIRYTLSAVGRPPSAVTLKVYNILGEEVVTLVDRIQHTGRYRVVWDGKDNGGIEVGSGVYFYQLRVHTQKGGVYQKTKKLVLLR